MPTIEGIPGFHIEDECQRIWRYLKLPQLLRILQEDQLHFSTPASFSDSFEGTLPKAWHELQAERHEALEQALGEDQGTLSKLSESRREQIRTNSYVSCWHSNQSESAAMWSRYDDANSTLAITSTVDALQNVFDQQEKYTIAVGEIEYVDYDSSIDEIDGEKLNAIREVQSGDDDELALLLLKREEFKFENEVRAVVLDDVLREDMAGEELSCSRSPTPPVDVPVTPSELISEIRLGPNASSWFAETVENAVERSKTDLTSDDVYRSDLDTEPIE